jgi:hypothetical protein
MIMSNRRDFLRGGLLLTAASAVGFSGVFGIKQTTADSNGDDISTIVNVAATAETFACTHYYRALTSKIKFTTQQFAYIKAALEEELIHLEFLNQNGASALATSFYFPSITFTSPVAFANVSAIAETVFVGAYLAATRRFAELGKPELAATAAQIAVVEGQHLALVRQTAGELPNNIAYGEPIFYNVSDAKAAVAPLLNGKAGALGAMESKAVDYPGADAIRKLIGKTTLSPVKPFTDPSLVPAPSTATPEATGSATEVATSVATP